MKTTPDLNERFEYQGRTYRVTGYAMIRVGYSFVDESVNIRLIHCSQENATAVVGVGVCGCIAPISKITRKGESPYLLPEQVSRSRIPTRGLSGNPLTLDRIPMPGGY